MHTLDSHKLKELLEKLKKHKYLIVSLFNTYSRPNIKLESEIRSAILDLFVFIGYPEYLDASTNSSKTLSDLFYDIRNSYVHQYRLLHSNGLDRKIVFAKIDKINCLTEALMAEVITNFKN